MNLIFLSQERIGALSAQVRREERLRRELHERAQAAMETPLQSVTFHQSPAASGDPHDYYSEGPYWWPDPDNPDGPYIRRDGEVNPERFNAHAQAKGTLADAVNVLANAGLFLEERRYHARAAELLRVFFVDEATRMNPNLNHAQAIRNVCPGRGIGIIDTAVFLRIVHGVNLIEACGGFEAEITGVKAWFRAYLHWMNTSKNGLEEKNHPNNHSNWWNTQAAAYSALVGDDAMLEACFARWSEQLLPSQTNDEGGFTDELTRTRSYHYSLYNLEASALLCEMAWQRGHDLWHAQSADGKGMARCVSFFKPYYINPFLWQRQEISPAGCWEESIAMKLAARRLNDTEIERANAMRRADVIPCRVMCHAGVLDLL